MTTRSGPVALVLAGAVQGPAAGQQWEGGFGTLFVSNFSGTALFQASIDNGATWIPVHNSGSGLAIGTLGADGVIPFMLGPCRIRASAGGGSMTIYAMRI